MNEDDKIHNTCLSQVEQILSHIVIKTPLRMHKEYGPLHAIPKTMKSWFSYLGFLSNLYVVTMFMIDFFNTI